MILFTLNAEAYTYKENSESVHAIFGGAYIATFEKALDTVLGLLWIPGLVSIALKNHHIKLAAKRMCQKVVSAIQPYLCK